jgi:hypothetical protein
MKTYVILTVAVLIFAVNLGTADCSDTDGGWNEAGIRMGIQAGPKREYFHLYEVFAVYGLPWDWRSSSGWGVTPQLNTSLGALHTEAETGFIGSLGTGLTLTKTGLNLVPELGISADLMDKRHFGRQDFGSMFLLGAYVGLSYRFDCGLGIGYRMLHLSNGHVFYPNGTPNPGLDLHMISISGNF